MTTLTSPTNYSLYSIPCLWAVGLATHFAAVNYYNTNKLGGGKEWDNNSPRGVLAEISNKAKQTPQERKYVRMEAANANTFENLGFWGVSILAGNFAKLPVATLNTFAGAYLASRVVYALLYSNTTSKLGATLRSVVFVSGIVMCFTLLIRSQGALQRLL